MLMKKFHLSLIDNYSATEDKCRYLDVAAVTLWADAQEKRRDTRMSKMMSMSRPMAIIAQAQGGTAGEFCAGRGTGAGWVWKQKVGLQSLENGSSALTCQK